MELFLGITIGLIVGVLIGIAAYNKIYKREMERQFSSLSASVLRDNATQLLEMAESKLGDKIKLGEQQLEGKKGLIDKSLNDIQDYLNKVERQMHAFDKSGEQRFGKIDERLKQAAKVIGELQTSTSGLQTALTSNSRRGQWGERMAEDVLRVAGLIEGVNYIKQTKMEQGNTRPDFTFLLPQNLKVNMDVKFPFNNYENYLNAKTDTEREKCKQEFLKDVKGRIKEIQSRAYINPEDKTLDYVLLFIPNEQVYTFINEIDRSLIDEAMRGKTILCSPLTLYAILAVIRQSIDNFAFEQKSKDMLALFGKFREQWGKFREAVETVGKRIGMAQDSYEELAGTRWRQVERPLLKIEEIRTERGIEVAGALEESTVEETFEKVSGKKIKEAVQ